MTFQACTRVVSRSSGTKTNGPFGENGALASNVTGNGLVTPLPAKTFSNGPIAGRVRRTSDPHGGALAALMKNCPLTNSPFMPYPARTDMRPSPVGSHARPTRGAKFSQSGLIPAWLGKPSSPGYVNPGGACGNTRLLWPARNRSVEKL